ncbi:hypothetical protein TL16_g10690 [Triparma laevis f. inornata]|uniref:Uncharacterized protein n=1 Tax=Triparma laevis f. inornata TaxID=1714386 RepID=A0A9W7EPN4_9STRA|nr:hypothetical protein TL16_g10690 [Triparma laevis f. inornata]
MSKSQKRNPNIYANSNRLAESRGLPAILFTCERGCERRATTEFREFLRYHMDVLLSTDDEDADTTSSTSPTPTAQMSLDDELAQLRASKGATSEVTNKKKSRAYGTDIFETGITGLGLAVFRSAERTDRTEPNSTEPNSTENSAESSDPNPKRLKTDDGEAAPTPQPPPTPAPTQERTIVNEVIYSIFSNLSSPSPPPSPQPPNSSSAPFP